jgi:hypothetical protein
MEVGIAASNFPDPTQMCLIPDGAAFGIGGQFV